MSSKISLLLLAGLLCQGCIGAATLLDPSLSAEERFRARLILATLPIFSESSGTAPQTSGQGKVSYSEDLAAVVPLFAGDFALTAPEREALIQFDQLQADGGLSSPAARLKQINDLEAMMADLQDTTQYSEMYAESGIEPPPGYHPGITHVEIARQHFEGATQALPHLEDRFLPMLLLQSSAAVYILADQARKVEYLETKRDLSINGWLIEQNLLLRQAIIEEQRARAAR